MKFMVRQWGEVEKIEVSGFDTALQAISSKRNCIQNMGGLPLAWLNEKGQLEYRLDLIDSVLKKCRLYRAKQRV